MAATNAEGAAEKKLLFFAPPVFGLVIGTIYARRLRLRTERYNCIADSASEARAFMLIYVKRDGIVFPRPSNIGIISISNRVPFVLRLRLRAFIVGSIVSRADN